MSNVIDRRAVIDALDEIRHVLDKKEKELTILPSAQPEPLVKESRTLVKDLVNDAISRQVAIVQLSHNKTGDDDCDVVIQNDIETIKALPSAEQNHRICRNCKWAKFYGNVDKNGNVESMWFCTNWDGVTDEEGFCHEWESR